jgi:hypothetical protein
MSGRRWAIGATLVALILVLPSQVTIRQLAMCLADVRSGKVTHSEPHAEGVRITDHFATWRKDELKGLTVVSPNGEAKVVESGSNWFVLSGSAPGFDDDYKVGAAPNSGLAKLANKLPKLPVTPAAVLVVLLGVLNAGAIWRWLRSGWWRRVPIVGWIASVVLLAVAFQGGKAGIKELLQFAEFAVFAVVLGVVCLDRRWRSTVVWATVGGALLVGIVGVAEFWWIVSERTPAGLADLGALDSILGFDWQAPRPYVRGTEASRNALAFYGVLMLPLLAVVSLDDRRGKVLRLVAAVAVALLVVCVQNLGLLLVGTLAATLAAGLIRKQLWLAVPVGVIVVTAIASFASPYGRVLTDSAAIHRYEDTFGLHPQPMRGLNGDATGSDWSPWQQKAIERQAAGNAILAAPIKGAGLGRYQEVINQYYSGGPMPALWVNKPPVNLMERDAHAVWLVLAVEGGVLLPLVLILSVLAAAMMGLRGYPRRREQAALWLALAIVLIAGGWMSSFMVRGLFGVTALIGALATTARNDQLRVE